MFEQTAIKQFDIQYNNNKVYRNYCKILGFSHKKIISDKNYQLNKLPFLPVEFFKTHRVAFDAFSEKKIFISSSTTGSIPSKHYIINLEVYEKSFIKGFENFYGNISNYCILGLLPSYLERSGSSLVYMVEKLINLSNNNLSGFFLSDFKKLSDTINLLEQQQQPYILIGVSFALLDFAKYFNGEIKIGTIMETGGMKGRGKEIIREELHHILKKSFKVNHIHSEYGMTELLSQAYLTNGDTYKIQPWMKVLVRDIDDPLNVRFTGKGAINIIDLANLYSCSFIATSDLGEVFKDGNFRITGRLDNSELRGCNLMVM